MNTSTLDLADLDAGLVYVRAALTELHNEIGTDEPSDVQRAAFEEGVAWITETEARVDQVVARSEQINRATTAIKRAGSAALVGGDGATAGFHAGAVTEDPYDMSTLRFNTPGSELTSRAAAAIERTVQLSDDAKQAATVLIETSDTPDGAVSRHVLATGAPAYRTAFAKLATGRAHTMTPDEVNAVELARAASLTTTAGGFAVPFTLDPTIIDTRAGSINPFRAISRRVVTTTNSWNGVSSAGVTASWDGEAAQVSDDAPTLAQPAIPVHKAQAFIPYSIEIGQDWAGIEADLQLMLVHSKDDLEAAAFATGLGAASNQPVGIVTALDNTASEIAPTTTETFAAADLYKLENALGPRYRARASWVANKAIFALIRQFDTQGGANLWERLAAGMPAELLGYPTFEASAMDGTFNAAVTADNYIAILGDFSHYVIVDRIGLSVEYVPHLFGANGRPTGQRGLYAYWRVGADSVNDAAFVALNLATTV